VEEGKVLGRSAIRKERTIVDKLREGDPCPEFKKICLLLIGHLLEIQDREHEACTGKEINFKCREESAKKTKMAPVRDILQVHMCEGGVGGG